MAKKVGSRKSVGPVLLIINEFGIEHISDSDWKDIAEVSRILFEEGPQNIYKSTVEALFIVMYEKVLMNQPMQTIDSLH